MKWWLAALAVALAFEKPAEPCAIAPPDTSARIQIVDEEALIIWDPATKTEHFIRRAQFASDAKAFGFLVPTPTPPKLTELDAEVFAILADRTAPQVEYRTERPWQLGAWLLEGCMLMKGDKAMPAGAPIDSGVRVLSTTNVAGYDATALQASDPSALGAWLTAHGFVMTPAIEQWLAIYVQKQWTMTAFVVAGAESTHGDVTTRAIDMTFQTDTPFYPYREPGAGTELDGVTSAPGRSLRVYFAAPQRHAATLATKPWAAKVSYAHEFSGVPGVEALLGASRYITAFIDETSPRRGIDELYFAPSVTGDVVPPPFVVTDREPRLIPVDMILIVGLFGLWIVRRLRRIRRRARAS
ncbi:MAG TPA: DUF2330 domain-containing protein [Kofleriaceae bacterium]|nr:DUF2330 domain-containing protein [Kofleriaceae bacterium]